MYVHDIRLQLAIRLVGHPRNEVRDLVLKDVEDMFAIKMDPLNMKKKTRIVNTCQILCLQCVKHFRPSEVRQSLLTILVLLQNGQKQKT